jgi:hypothetical protein
MEIDTNCVYRSLVRFTKKSGRALDKDNQPIFTICQNNTTGQGVLGALVLQELLGNNNLLVLDFEDLIPEIRTSNRKAVGRVSSFVRSYIAKGKHVFVEQPGVDGVVGHLEHFAPNDNTNMRKMGTLHIMAHSIVDVGTGSLFIFLDQENI